MDDPDSITQSLSIEQAKEMNEILDHLRESINNPLLKTLATPPNFFFED